MDIEGIADHWTGLTISLLLDNARLIAKRKETRKNQTVPKFNSLKRKAKE
jgi:hypothetical protein